jgi:hypothetical protein
MKVLNQKCPACKINININKYFYTNELFFKEHKTSSRVGILICPRCGNLFVGSGKVREMLDTLKSVVKKRTTKRRRK